MGKWSSDEIEELKSFYKENDVPSDQLVKNKSALDIFTSIFNEKVGLSEKYSSEEIADKLFRLRKSGKLPRIRD